MDKLVRSNNNVPNPTTTVIAVVDADSSQYPDGTSSSTSKGGTSSIQTADGTVRVQRFRSSRSKKLRAMITFTPRTSAFDRENASSGNDPFRGFFTLFWICVFIFIVRTYVTYYETSGYPLSLAFATLFSKDAKTLALSDAVLVSSTGLSVLFVKLIQKGWIRYYWTGVIIQHVYQAVMLGVAVQWTFNRQWPWVQSGFFTLHCLVMLMKVHSYVAINGYLSWVFKSQIETIKTLREACVAPSIGGYEKAIQVAKVEKEKLEEKEKLLNGVESNTTGSSPAPGTPALLHEQPVSTSYDSTLSSNLRQRLLNVPARQSPDITSSSSPPTSNTLGSTTPSYFLNQPEDPVYEHPLVYHPDEIIQTLAQSITDMEAELCSMGKKRVRWPDNISLYNFMDYQLIPTLVYELEYPRTERIRPAYIFEKTVATFGTFTLLYTVAEHYIIPLTPQPGQSFFRSLLDLALPFMLSYLLLFYLIFECICNGFAELSFFADRQFYEDWWNSTSQDEFSRKWNKPVHTFLLRHVYASTISAYSISRPSATFLTFLLSAAVHELIMAIVTKKIRMYLFLLQMAQIPMIALGRLPAVRQNKWLGNIVFWVGLLTGFPLLCVAYCAY